MAESRSSTTGAMHQVTQQKENNAITLRVPRPNIQVAVLGLVAFITLFQTFQLIRINGSSNASSVKAAPAATVNTTSTGTGTGSNASTPQSMVGGC